MRFMSPTSIGQRLSIGSQYELPFSPPAVMTVGLISFFISDGPPRSEEELPETLYFGSPAGPGELRGVASPPHDGFAFYGYLVVLLVGDSGTVPRLPA